MGCCYSTPGPPENDLWYNMPEPGTAHTFQIKGQGMFSDDYLVHNMTNDPNAECDESNRQLFLDKEGSWKSNKCTVEVANYHNSTLGKPVDPENDKKGQSMWKAAFDDCPRFDQHVSWGAGRHERMFGFFDGYESDDDSFYWNQSHKPPGREINRFLVKWSMNAKVKIAPGKTGFDNMQFRPGMPMTLHVFAKGTATRIITKHTSRDKETGRRETEYNDSDREFVDWIEYKLTPANDESICIALWRCDGMGRDSSWDNPLFSAHNDSGFFSDGPVTCQTKEGWDPLLGLLLAHLCTTEYSPQQLMADFTPYFPSRHQYRGNLRPRGAFFDPYGSGGQERGEQMVNGAAYKGGVSCEPESIMALDGYVDDYFVNPPLEEIEEVAALPMPPLLKVVPAHMEVGPDGLLVFMPISFETLEPPPPLYRADDAPEDDGALNDQDDGSSGED